MRDLTKWPRLLVVGEDVPPERADEILVRTNRWFMTSNDRGWTGAIFRLLDVETDGFGYPGSDALRALERRLDVLDLHHLHNEQVACAWIGGPKGWVDWNGRVGCSDWNVGKWPTVKEVTEDWIKIADAFPYLDLTAQLVPDEGEASEPAATWTVADGQVTAAHWVTEKITEPTPAEEIAGRWIRSMWVPGRERGVTLDRLVGAVRRVAGG